MPSIWRIVASIFCICAFGIEAVAQNAPLTLTSGAYEEKLDALFSAHDTDALNHAVLFDVHDHNTAMRALNWLHLKEAHDGSSYIEFLYTSLLWKMGAALPEPNPFNLKMMLLRAS